MPDHIPLLLVVIVAIGLIFDFTNGFHDTANAVATVISTRVLPPSVAIGGCAILNFLGAFGSQKVAGTISKGLVDAHAATQEVILAALVGAIVWNVITWYYGIPNSSSHALIGGLVGSTLVFAGLNHVIWKGVLDKVIIPMVLSPILGGFVAFVIMSLLFALFANTRPEKVSGIFHWLQRLSAAFVSYFHGQNDAQKTMGVITLALVAFHLLPASEHRIPTWVIASCATAMGLGTAMGGYRIIKTLGSNIIRLEPINGFAAESAASIILATASKFGFPVSTTHIVCGSVFGVGIAKRLNEVRWTTAQRMAAAWVITLPAAATVAGLTFLLINLLPHAPAAAVAIVAH
jgi:PiT family inorganic phosphate transporter